MTELAPNMTLAEAKELHHLLLEIEELTKRLNLTRHEFAEIRAYRDNLEWIDNCTMKVTDDEIDQIALTRDNLEWIHGYPPEER